MAGTLAEEIGTSKHFGSRQWLRRSLVIAAGVIAAATCLLTVYRVFPELVLHRALHYETYDSREGLRLGLQDFEERHQKYRGNGGGGTGLIPIDLDRRYVLITVPYVNGDDNPEAQSLCWAILDTEREEIAASLRIPKASDAFLGAKLKSHTRDRVPRISDSGLVSWSISCSATLPDWWAGRKRVSDDGSISRFVGVSFDCQSDTWGRTPVDFDWSDEPQRLRWLQRLNRPMAIANTDDELVAEHEWSREEYPRPVFRRLSRRSRIGGEIRWAIEPGQYPQPGLRGPETRIVVPSVQQGRASDWCVLVEESVHSQFSLLPVIWKLDLANGSLQKLDLPIQSTPRHFEIGSDGQTVVFIDNGFVHTVNLGGISTSTNVRGGNTAERTTWHPKQGVRTLLEFRNGAQYLMALPKRRVLLVNDGGRDAAINVQIVPLDGSSPRQIFP
jgi:hypothetical protein